MKQSNVNSTKKRGLTSNEATSPLKMEKKYGCSLCPFSSNVRRGINHHRSTKHGLKPILPEPEPPKSPCQYCDKVLSTISARKKHVREKHPETLSDALKCNVCNDIFVTSSSLKHHKTLFHGDKPYQRTTKLCNICGTEVSSMKKHLKSHILDNHKKEQSEKNPMPFGCKHCK